MRGILYNRYLLNKYKFLLFIYCLSIFYVIVHPFKIAGISNLIDEILVVVTFLYGLIYCHILNKKSFQIFTGIIVFYVAYSLCFGCNVYQAVILDALQFLKPFICFYVGLYSGINLNNNKIRKALFILASVIGGFSFLLLPIVDNVYPNTAAYYQLSIFSTILYLLSCKEITSKHMLIALLLLSTGLVSLRSKFVAEYICFIFIFWIMKERLKFNIKTIILLSILVLSVIYFNIEKFTHYFLDADYEGVARTALYWMGLKVMFAYIPFGSGFGTWGTEATRQYYSPLYYEYGISHIWGCRPEDLGTSHSFVADTFYPTLVQFGIVGFILYIIFWWKMIVNVNNGANMREYKLFLFVFLFISIQNIAGSGNMLGPESVPTFLLLGMVYSTIMQNEKTFNNRTCLQR